MKRQCGPLEQEGEKKKAPARQTFRRFGPQKLGLQGYLYFFFPLSLFESKLPPSVSRPVNPSYPATKQLTILTASQGQPLQMDENTDGVTAANALDSVMADGGGGGVKTHTTIEQSGGDARAQSSKAATCGVCSTEPPKYKCPRCYMP